MKYVIAAVYDNFINAHIAKGVLEEENIRCWLKDENIIAVEPGLTYAAGGIKLMVTEVQLERALSILKVKEQASIHRNICPDCGSSNIGSVDSPHKAVSILGRIANALIPEDASKIYHCFDCDYEFGAS